MTVYVSCRAGCPHPPLQPSALTYARRAGGSPPYGIGKSINFTPTSSLLPPTCLAYTVWGGIMRRRKKRMKWAAVAILLLLIAVCLGLLTLRFQRIFMEYAINICEDSAIKEVGVLMEDEVFSHPEEFSNLVVLERDSDNRITALRTDIIAVGKIKARLVSGLFDRLDYLEETQIEVPLGTVFAPNLFTGMGPKVKVGLAGLTQMEAEFVSAFTSAGINQTRHRILIEVHAGFRILTPFGGEDREIVSTYPVTDTVIVGTVPERYAYIGSADGNLLGEIRDYDTDSDISRENRK